MAPDPAGDGRKEALLSIAAASDLLDIPIPTIRSWERRYSFPAPARTSGKHRRYSAGEVGQLRALRDVITQGHAAKEAVDLVRGGVASHGVRDPRIEALLRAAIDLDPNAARGILHEGADVIGVEATIVSVGIPAMAEIGSRWKAGTCDAANEHLLTDVFRAWLSRTATMTSLRSPRSPVLLACGPKDLHTVGLEAFGVLLARRGRPVVMLGALTPVNSLRVAIETTRPSAAVIVSQRSVNRRSTVESVVAAHRLLAPRAHYGGAAFSSPSSRRDVPGIYLGTDLLEAARAVERACSAA